MPHGFQQSVRCMGEHAVSHCWQNGNLKRKHTETNLSQEAGQETQQDALWKRFFKAVWFIFALFGRTFRILFMVALILGVLVFVVYTMQLDENVRSNLRASVELPHGCLLALGYVKASNFTLII